MRRPYRNVDVFTNVENYLSVVERDHRHAPRYEPVLGAASVFLIAQPLARQNLDAFDFVPLALVEDGEIAPGALIVPWRIIIHRREHQCSPLHEISSSAPYDNQDTENVTLARSV